MYTIYFLWTIVDTILVSLRITSLVYITKSYRFLAKKAQEKKRRRLAEAEKSKKKKRALKNELKKQIQEKKADSILRQQRINKKAQDEAQRREFLEQQAERSMIYQNSTRFGQSVGQSSIKD